MNGKSEQVYQWLQVYIDENKFSNNQRIPSENALSKRLNVSRETVRAAMSQLSAEGLIYRVKGSGSFINKEIALSQQLPTGEAHHKVGLILQGQDVDANSSLMEGIRSVIPSDKMELRVFLTDNKFSNERKCLQTVVNQGFSGFIVDGVKASLLNPNLDCYRGFYQKKLPVIFYNNYYHELNYPRVINNDLVCADQLLSLLTRAGHRRIASIFVYDNYQSIQKFQGMVASMRKYSIEFQDTYVKWCISDEAHDHHFVRAITRFLKSLPKCTAIVCCNHMILQLLKQALLQMGKSVPEDYSLVCFDYSKSDWEITDTTCSVHQGYQIGCQTAARLMQMMEHKDFPSNDYSLVLRSKIHIGTSIKQM